MSCVLFQGQTRHLNLKKKKKKEKPSSLSQITPQPPSDPSQENAWLGMMVIDKQTQQSIRILAVFRHALLLLPSNPSAMASLLTAIPPLNKHPRPTSLSPLAASVPTEDD